MADSIFLMNFMTSIYATYFVAIILIALIAIITGVLSILSNKVPQDIKDKYKDIDFDLYERGGWNLPDKIFIFTPQGRAMNMLNVIWSIFIMLGVAMILGAAFDDETASVFNDNPGAFFAYLVFFFALMLEVPQLILFRRDSRPWYHGGWLPNSFLIFVWCGFLYQIIKGGIRGLFEGLIELAGALGVLILGVVALLVLGFTFFSLLEKFAPKTFIAWFEDDGYERPGTMAEQNAKWKKIIDKEKKEQQTKTTVKRKKLTKKTAKK
tara:strand:+ start:268 stop:1065 length:798 start_codon:yes stop_codon:yes gene_type:complete